MNEFKPRKEFAFRKLNQDGVAKCEEIAIQFERLALFIEMSSSTCAEVARAINKLEEACYYAKKAILNERKNQFR